MSLQAFRHGLDCAAILKSDEPILQALVSRDYTEALQYSTVITAKFLEVAYPDQIGIAPDIAALTLERNPTWTLPDVVNFYKSILMRQDIECFNVMGNRITIQKLMEMMGGYDNLIAEARERLLAEKKGQAMGDTSRREASSNDIKSLMGKQLERIQVEKEKNGTANKPMFDTAPGEKWFNKNPIN